MRVLSHLYICTCLRKIIKANLTWVWSTFTLGCPFQLRLSRHIGSALALRICISQSWRITVGNLIHPNTNEHWLTPSAFLSSAIPSEFALRPSLRFEIFTNWKKNTFLSFSFHPKWCGLDTDAMHVYAGGKSSYISPSN